MVEACANMCVKYAAGEIDVAGGQKVRFHLCRILPKYPDRYKYNRVERGAKWQIIEPITTGIRIQCAPFIENSAYGSTSCKSLFFGDGS